MPPIEKEKLKALEQALQQIDRQFGKGALVRLGDKPQEAIQAISTGSINLDIALGIGGVPRGRVIEIFGPESSGKTTLDAPHHRRGPEGRRHRAPSSTPSTPSTPSYAKKLGVDIDEPARLPARLRRAGARDRRGARPLQRRRRHRHRLRRGPRPEGRARRRDGRLARRPPGPPHAPGPAQAHRRRLASPSTCLIFINQIREKIGVMFGNPETTTGGRALKFYSSVRLDIRRIDSIKDGDGRSSATAPRSRSSRTRSPRPSRTPSSTSSTAKASPRRAS